MPPNAKPKKAAAKPSKERELYVGLLESESMQRELLEARKNALVLLKRMEKLVLLREQRLYVEGELRSAILALASQIHGVMASLPELPAEHEAKASAKAKPAAPARTGPDRHALTELDRKLAEIDKRLADLEK